MEHDLSLVPLENSWEEWKFLKGGPVFAVWMF